MKIIQLIEIEVPDNCSKLDDWDSDENESASENKIEVPIEDTLNPSVTNSPRRSRGRPKIVRTGLPGRPRKEYKTTCDKKSTESTESEILESEQCEFAFSAEVSYSQAMQGPSACEWRDAMKEELRAHLKNGTWKLVERPKGRTVLGCRMVLRNKYNPDGTIQRRKARLVAKGYAQKPGVDFSETFAPVARLSSIRMVMALAAENKLQVEQLDITTAYLHGSLREEVFMDTPVLYEELLAEICQEGNTDAAKMLKELRSGKRTCLLVRALYGLKQAGRQWHEKLNEDLVELGLKPLNGDSSIYISSQTEQMLIVATYVDDLIIASNDTARIKDFKHRLSQRLQVKDLGKIKYCLGLEFSQTEGEIFLKQKGYINDILERFNMKDCKPVATPMDAGQKLSKPAEPFDEKQYPYRQLIGSLMYLAVGTRPDISFAVSTLSQYNSNFGSEHWTAAKRVLRYLKGTRDLGLKYSKTDKPIIGYVDADWAGCVTDRKSCTGYSFIFGGTVTSWESRKQATVALSTTEAEYMGLTEAAKEAIYLQRFVSECTSKPTSKIKIYNDNQGAQELARNPIFHSRTKHIDIKHHFVREALRDGYSDLDYLPTKEMPADVLTKALPGPAHRECIARLGMIKCPVFIR